MDFQTNWYTGLNGYKKHTLDLQNKTFTTEIIDQEYSIEESLEICLYKILKEIKTPIEVCYSGGIDSEFILKTCISHKIPCIAITMILQYDDLIMNTHDLFYAEKFCRNNNIKQVFFTLNVKEFYKSGEYMEYLKPYSIIEPHVASHFWLIKHCNSFPVIAGDWPWVQTHKSEKIISPWRIDYNSYERFMNDNKIKGIGNMLSYSYELSYNIAKRQIQNTDVSRGSFAHIHHLKSKLFPNLESRLKSYGWENFPKQVFNILDYKVELIKTIGLIKNSISWNNQFKYLLSSNITTNSEFN